MFLKLDRIRKEFNGKVAVDDLSLEVPRGVIYGIIGPNGAGKTTTIRMIMNITIPDSGSITLEGARVGKGFTNRVGYLPEERGLYKKMTLQEIMIYLAELKGMAASESSKKLDYWLERIGLMEYKNKKVEELSKGMQQKLQFVTTILHDPDILILDEIFSGLDPLNIELIKDIIMEMKRAEKTILFSTHVMEQAEKLCDHLCMISGGKKVIDGTLTDVKSQFGKNSIQIDIEGDGGFISSLPGVKKMTEFNNYIELHIEDGTDTNGLLKAIADKVLIRRFDIVEPSLYDIFIDMAKIDPLELEREGEVANV
ncbi:MAG: ATP-binding cassette domain-containing protein [Candidatus Zixiibacteriota bacterium]|nr:MAG: ATP-binding cassette domain-containing protein [candidate division Zixibacteria bacterium]